MAQIFRDFSTDIQGSQPANTTLKRSAVSGDYTVQADGQSAVRYLNNSNTVAARGLAYSITASGTTEILSLVKDSLTAPSSARLVAFASDAPDNEYGVIISSDPGQVESLVVYRRVSGSYSKVGGTSRIAVSSTLYYEVRFLVVPGSPNALKAKYWLEGDPEPSAWDIEATDSNLSLTAGWVGHVGFDGDGPEVYVKRIGIGTDGAAAPSAPTEAPPVNAPVIGAPTATKTSVSAPFTFDESSNTGDPATSFDVRLDGGLWESIGLPNPLELNVSKLDPGSAYVSPGLEMRAVNSGGAGPVSAAVQFSTEALVLTPVDLNTSNIDADSAQLNWSAG